MTLEEENIELKNKIAKLQEDYDNAVRKNKIQKAEIDRLLKEVDWYQKDIVKVIEDFRTLDKRAKLKE